MRQNQILAFRRDLLAWYRTQARDLPWRRTGDPYLIWISEIMLQQTRVAAVLDHYARFTESFPSVHQLAEAGEAEVLALWSGLGYYRRARNMHRAAQELVATHGGVFPRTAAALMSLPGIGTYTAAAVASIAFQEAVAVVDGNVERVLTRVAALDVAPVDAARVEQDKTLPAKPIARRVRELAARLVDPDNPSHFNQAMMELGATLCLPRKPLCLQCPVQAHCLTRGEHATVARKPLLPRDAFFALVERQSDGHPQFLLEQRPQDASLMPGMWQLTELIGPPPEAIAARILCTVKHSITVTKYTVRVYECSQDCASPRANRWAETWVSPPDAAQLPLTGLTRKILQRLRTRDPFSG